MENNQPATLTAEEILIKNYESIFEKYGDPIKAPHYRISDLSSGMYRPIILQSMQEYVDQQTAQLKSELEAANTDILFWKNEAKSNFETILKLRGLLKTKVTEGRLKKAAELHWQSYCHSHNIKQP